MPANLAPSMRRDWDERARKNAFHYIASWRREWDLESFLASGGEDVEKLVTPILSRCGLPLGGRAMIELGCGAGRMTHRFARCFERVYAFDVSREMLRRAVEIHRGQGNVLWMLSNGSSFSCIPSSSVDFVFSYLVLQHLPSEDLVFQYVREMLRVLRGGGVFLFQFNGGMEATMNWRGQLAWGIVDTLWSARMARLSRAIAAVFGLDPSVAGRSWRGAAVEGQRVARVVRDARGKILELSGENTPMAWCCGVKAGGNA